jgi:eukaryotic-like serine/threonine-protein kinase
VRVPSAESGIKSAMADETEITGSYRARRPGPPPQRPPGPPPGLIRDIWPWLGLLGLLVLAGLLVWVFVLRDRHHRHVVPAVVGLRRGPAIRRLTEDGYSVTAILGPSAKPNGIVVSQKPGGGSQLPRGERVAIHVSNGRPVGVTTTTTAATTQRTTTAATTAVPGVVGQDLASGAGQVEAAGFVAETDPVTGSQQPGQIVSETPTGEAPAGSTVQLAVAVGADRPQRSVPGVVGRTASDARAALVDAQLTVRTEYRSAPKKDVGNVLAQSPSGGTVPAYTQVTITVGR